MIELMKVHAETFMNAALSKKHVIPNQPQYYSNHIFMLRCLLRIHLTF